MYKMHFKIIQSLSLCSLLLTKNSCYYVANDVFFSCCMHLYILISKLISVGISRRQLLTVKLVYKAQPTRWASLRLILAGLCRTVYLLFVPFVAGESLPKSTFVNGSHYSDITRYCFHLMAYAIIYCVVLQDRLLTTGARKATRAKHICISLSCGQ